MPSFADDATITIGMQEYCADVIQWIPDFRVEKIYQLGQRECVLHRAGPTTYSGSVTFSTLVADSHPFNAIMTNDYRFNTVGLNYRGRNFTIWPTGYNTDMTADGMLYHRINFGHGYEIQASSVPCQPNHNGPSLIKPMAPADLEEFLGAERLKSAYERIGNWINLGEGLAAVVPHQNPAADLAALLYAYRPFALIDPDLMSSMDEVLVLFQLCLRSSGNSATTFTFRDRVVMAVGKEQLLKEVTNATREDRFIEHIAHLYGLDHDQRSEFLNLHEPKGFNWVH